MTRSHHVTTFTAPGWWLRLMADIAPWSWLNWGHISTKPNRRTFFLNPIL
jgi:hypothetical protein